MGTQSTLFDGDWNNLNVDIRRQGIAYSATMEDIYQAFKQRLKAELVARHTSASAFYEDDKLLSGAPLIDRKFI